MLELIIAILLIIALGIILAILLDFGYLMTELGQVLFDLLSTAIFFFMVGLLFLWLLWAAHICERVC